MRDNKQCELEVLAEVGKLLISKLDGRDDLARAIFDALSPVSRPLPIPQDFEPSFAYTRRGKGRVEGGDHRKDARPWLPLPVSKST